MPISTPEKWLTKYSNDKDHFKHVLDHFLIPSLEKIDLKPISPITKGSELIQAEIITNIETADLVLCDISTLNPNVFFELGVRTALNKPVCLIKDDVTPKIPFDTASINHHEYLSALNPWTLNEQIDALTNHIEESQKKNNDTNSLWKYFSLSSTAHPVELEEGIDGKIDFLTMQIEALRGQLSTSKTMQRKKKSDEIMENIVNQIYMTDQIIKEVLIDGDEIIVVLELPPSSTFLKYIENIRRAYRVRIDLMSSHGNKIF